MRANPALPLKSCGGVFAALFLAACGTTHFHESSAAPIQPTRAGAVAPDASGAPSAPAFAAAFQETDYRPTTLFKQNHADMINHARGFQPNATVSFSLDHDQGLKGEGGDFDITQIGGEAWHEIVVDPDSWIRVGGKFVSRDFDFSSGVFPPDDDETVYETGLILGGGTFLEPHFFVEGQFEPGVYSDFEGSVDSDAFQFFGHLRGTYQAEENLFWRFGVRHDRLFEDLDVYPELGLMWQFAEQWRLNVYLPHVVEVRWNPTDSLLVDMGLSLQGQVYEVRGPSQLGSGEFDWQTQEMRLYARSTLRFDDTLSAFATIGSTIGGDYEFNGVAGNIDGTPEGSLFFEVGSSIDW